MIEKVTRKETEKVAKNTFGFHDWISYLSLFVFQMIQKMKKI